MARYTISVVLPRFINGAIRLERGVLKAKVDLPSKGTDKQEALRTLRYDLNRSFFVGGSNYHITRNVFAGVMPHISRIYAKGSGGSYMNVADKFEIVDGSANTNGAHRMEVA